MSSELDSGETIAAIATASGVGGVGIVRVSGPRAIAIVADSLGIAGVPGECQLITRQRQ